MLLCPGTPPRSPVTAQQRPGQLRPAGAAPRVPFLRGRRRGPTSQRPLRVAHTAPCIRAFPETSTARPEAQRRQRPRLCPCHGGPVN